jgi:hypothetical protein
VDTRDIDNREQELMMDYGIWARIPIVPKLNNKASISQRMCGKKRACPSLQKL